MGLWSIIVPEATQNLVTNPSLEDATTGYTAVGAAIARDSTKQRRGVYSLKVTPTAGVNDGAYYGITLSTTKQYAFSVDGFWANGVPYKIYIYDVTAGVTLGSALQFTGAGKWERKTVVAMTGANTSCRLYVTKDNSADTTIFYLDGWQCEQKAYATTYVDGDQDGCSWDGAAHASTSQRSAQWRLGGKEVDFDSFTGVTVALPYSGIGMPPLSNLKQDRALLPGALYRDTKINERVITLTFTAQGTALANLHLLRKQLIDTIKPDLVTPKQPFLLRYSGVGIPVEIPCVYDSGLEFSNLFGNSETFAMRCIAYDEPLWKEDGERGLAITAASQSLSVARIVSRIAGIWGNMAGGMDASVRALAIGPDGTVYAGGDFLNAGGGGANRIAKWNGSSWSALGTGMDLIVNALAIAPDGSMYAGGQFTTAGGVTVNRVAKWNGSAWSALGTGMNNTVEALAIGNDGNLWAGGAFTTAGGVGVSRIAKWDGSAWSSPGVGLDNTVRALAVGTDVTIYAGGDFTGRVSRWNGSSWSVLSTGMDNAVFALAIAPDGSLYAGGQFTTAGGITANRIAQWNGTTWRALGTGANNIVYTTGVAPDGTLYVGGLFTTIGGLTLAEYAAKWNGSVWSALDIDLPGVTDIKSVAFKGTDLYFGFSTTGTATAAANYDLSQTVQNPSTATAYPIFRIKRTGGTSATLTHIRNETTGKTLYFNYALADGEIVTIDLRLGKKSIRSSSVGNALSRLLPNSDLATWALAPGDNRITFLIVPAGSPTLDVKMQWKVTHWSADGAAS